MSHLQRNLFINVLDGFAICSCCFSGLQDNHANAIRDSCYYGTCGYQAIDGILPQEWQAGVLTAFLKID